jgi:hypothetical protein
MISPVDLPPLVSPTTTTKHQSNLDNVRRLQDLVHALRPKCALHQVTNGDGADESREAGILTLFLCRPLLEDLGGAKRRLQWLLAMA